LKEHDLRGATRQRAVVQARHVAIYLSRQLTEWSLQQIGAYYGGRDHSTVLHACRKVEEQLKTDPGFVVGLRALRAELG